MRIPQPTTYNKRCRISHRPQFGTGEPVFYNCPECGALFILNNTGRDSLPSPKITCCEKELKPLSKLNDPDILKEHEIDYTVFGGLDNNGLHLEIDSGSHPMDDDHRIEWVYIRTFQGGQLKYLTPGFRATADFSFANEDAYVYCDRPICKLGHEHCQFECKRDMYIYAFCSRHGLVECKMCTKDQ